MATSTLTPIPEPRGYPILGNIADVDPDSSLESFKSLAEKHGDIYRLQFPGTRLVIVSTVAFVDEICDEERFMKVPRGVLEEIRNGIHDGLFTAHITEPNWAIAHRILMPAFGPKGIQNMFDEMHDIASQLVMKWARVGPVHKIHLTDDFTNLALDTLGLCSMGFRFNNFYHETEHPFVRAMAEFLIECGRRPQRIPLPSFFYQKTDEQFQANINIMRETAQSILRERVANPEEERKDLLTAMLRGVDSQTGQRMSEDSIINNLITFLIAGHETTAGTLSYAVYELLKHPEAYRKVQQEVDAVVGTGPVTVQHMQKLPYLDAVLRETLRLDSPIPILARVAREDGTILGGKYAINKDDNVLGLLTRAHLDPAVYENPTEFCPERMLSANFNSLPKNAWKPFGTGVRSCIGRPFAWQESLLALALIFQNFDLELDDPSYTLAHKQTLTIKPKDLYIRAKLRHGLNATNLSCRLAGEHQASHLDQADTRQKAAKECNETISQYPLTILYGSNSGTCEMMAQQLSLEASSRGYFVSGPKCLNDAVDNLPLGQPVIIFTCSYEGEPPHNAARFVPWLESLPTSDQMKEVKYAVFGCGNAEWPQTFHRIPKLIDSAFSAAGAQRLVDLKLADAAHDDMFTVFENWQAECLWPALGVPNQVHAASSNSDIAATSGLKLTQSTTRSSILGYNMQQARVLAARRLTAESEPEKIHVEIELPRSTPFRAGDYLVVLPTNPYATVMRVLRRFRLPSDAYITLKGAGARFPTGSPVSVSGLLSEFFELGQPATRKDLSMLANAAKMDSKEQSILQNFDLEGNSLSVLDIIEQIPSMDIDLGDFLRLLPPMRSRQYSISSSPLHSASKASLTVSVLKAKGDCGHGDFNGVCSSYLASVQPGDIISLAVRASHNAFHLPSTPESTPVVMIAAGTGIAPFRGFIQERVAMISSGIKVAPAFLYHGCRQPGQDDLYTDEAAEWEKVGAVHIKRAFSRNPELSNGCKHVQDIVWDDRYELLQQWRQGCFLFVCGSKKVSNAVAKLAIEFKRDIAKEENKEISEESATMWWNGLRNIRYAFDVFD